MVAYDLYKVFNWICDLCHHLAVVNISTKRLKIKKNHKANFVLILGFPQETLTVGKEQFF